MKILILCTGNSCRSQMAEGILKNNHPDWQVFSAGTKPADKVHPFAIAVMNELGIDLSKNKPKLIDEFINQKFDYVITVCDDAKETCPIFTGNVNKRIHIAFDDPAKAVGTEEDVLKVFRKVRNQMIKQFSRLKLN